MRLARPYHHWRAFAQSRFRMRLDVRARKRPERVGRLRWRGSPSASPAKKIAGRLSSPTCNYCRAPRSPSGSHSETGRKFECCSRLLIRSSKFRFSPLRTGSRQREPHRPAHGRPDALVGYRFSLRSSVQPNSWSASRREPGKSTLFSSKFYWRAVSRRLNPSLELGPPPACALGPQKRSG